MVETIAESFPNVTIHKSSIGVLALFLFSLRDEEVA